jgi:polyisoprenoid-binding protein YceI
MPDSQAARSRVPATAVQLSGLGKRDVGRSGVGRLGTGLLVAWLLAAPLSAKADDDTPVYRLDPVHTRVLVAVDHAGFSQALGTVSGSTGTLRFDGKDWQGAQLEARVPIARLDFGDAAWNRATLAGNLLDAADHPEARFVSTRIEPLAADRATVHGMLTLRGVSREIALDVRLNAAKRHPLPPFRRTLGFSATATLSRSAFGIDAWPSVIGDSVSLRIEAEAVRGRAQDEDSDTPEPTTERATEPAAAPSAPAAATQEPTP